jgi:hypothetical protein
MISSPKNKVDPRFELVLGMAGALCDLCASVLNHTEPGPGKGFGEPDESWP